MQISFAVMGLRFEETECALWVYCAYGYLWRVKPLDRQLRVRLGDNPGLGADVFGLEFCFPVERFECLPAERMPLSAPYRKNLVRLVEFMREHGDWFHIGRGLFHEEDAGHCEVSRDEGLGAQLPHSSIEDHYASTFAAALASEAGCAALRGGLKGAYTACTVARKVLLAAGCEKLDSSIEALDQGSKKVLVLSSTLDSESLHCPSPDLAGRPDGFDQGAVDKIKKVLLATGKREVGSR